MRPYEAERERRMAANANCKPIRRPGRDYSTEDDIQAGRQSEAELIAAAERESIRRGGAPVEEPLPWER